MFNFAKACRVVRVMNAVAAGVTDQNGTSVDTLGYEGVAFVAAFGALTAGAVTSLKAQQSSDNGVADAFADLKGTGVPLPDSGSNKVLILDVFRPRERYVRPVIDRETANAAIDGVYAILYGAAEEPVEHDASVQASELHVSPAEGVA